MPKLSDVPFTPEAHQAVPPSVQFTSQVQLHLPPLTTPETRPPRWLTFEEETSIDQIAIIGALSLLLVGGFWVAFNRLLGHTIRNGASGSAVTAPTAVTPLPSESPRVKTFPRLSKPTIPVESMHGPINTLHDAPAPVGESTYPAQEPAVVLGKLSVRFIAPRVLDVQWDSLGEGYSYRLYWAMTSGLYDPQPVLEQPLPVPYLVWTPDEELHDFWLAVKGFDSEGRETGFSPPTQIHVPR